MPFAGGQTSPRARDLGVPFDGAPGPLNAITDVKGYLDRETIVGVAVFDGRITGEPLVNDELGLIFHLLEQVSCASATSGCTTNSLPITR